MISIKKLPRELSIVVPVYGSSRILPTLVEEIEKAMEAANLLDSFELILVNDASPDDSWSAIVALATAKPYIKGINLRKNAGQHNSVMAGLTYACGQYVVLMDDDLQHPPSVINAMLMELKKGYDVCYTRYENRQHSWWKKMGSAFNDWVAGLLLEKPENLYLSSFKAMKGEVAAEVVKYDGPYTYLDGLILSITDSLTSIDIEHKARLEGQSTYTLRKLISLWLKMATSFSIVPLRLATYAGFFLAVCSLAVFVFVIATKIRNPGSSPGWASLMATMLFIGSVQTLCIGMIGEYLGRTYLKLNKKPQFTVRNLTWKDGVDHE